MDGKSFDQITTQVKNLIEQNSFCHTFEDYSRKLFCFKSFFNHGKDANIKFEFIDSNLLLVFALKDIK